MSPYSLKKSYKAVSFFAEHFKAGFSLYLVSDKTSPLTLSVPFFCRVNYVCFILRTKLCHSSLEGFLDDPVFTEDIKSLNTFSSKINAVQK